VLGDHSAGGLSPQGWAARVAGAAAAHKADEVVAEGNQGGAMVKAVLEGAGLRRPVRMVQARVGKAARAAPVAALFEAGRAKFAGVFPALEAELTGLCGDGRYEPGSWSGPGGPGASPDRADAMVWALTRLMLGGGGGAPAVRGL
jgi:phage terminase large subunit-like protein